MGGKDDILDWLRAAGLARADETPVLHLTVEQHQWQSRGFLPRDPGAGLPEQFLRAHHDIPFLVERMLLQLSRNRATDIRNARLKCVLGNPSFDLARCLAQQRDSNVGLAGMENGRYLAC